MSIYVFAKSKEFQDKAQALADKLHLSRISHMKEAGDEDLVLIYSDRGLALSGQGQTMRGDFTKSIRRLKINNLNGELLVKAAKIKNFEGQLRAVDATAGLGEDSILLAAAGFEVDLYEYNPIIAALLEDALERGANVPELADAIARMHFHQGDSLEAMEHLSYTPNVILLDPMFPARQKSAAVKKKFQLLQQLEMPASNGEQMLEAAMKAHPHKILIKRPAKGEYLADRKPDYSIGGKAIRYDCIVIA